jgi:hypothetical protein
MRHRRREAAVGPQQPLGEFVDHPVQQERRARRAPPVRTRETAPEERLVNQWRDHA